MNIRERVTSQEVLAVSLALIMLMSVAGMAFIGGAGAQATGGTYDQVFSESEDVSNELNVDTGSVELVGPDATNGRVDGVNVSADGQIKISGTNAENEFQGITLSTERIAAASGVSAPADDSLADFLADDVPAEYNVSTNKSAGDAIPAVFIEFDPQSDFSQINKTERVRGNHDYIVVAPANASSGTLGANDQLNGTVDTNLNASINNNISEGDIVALSVENTDSSGANSSLLANASDFGTVFNDLVGTSESDLQNDNIDQVQFAAGTFDGTSVSIQEVQLNDDIGANVADGETIHHNKIVLDDGSSTTSFSSISAAVNASNGDNTITVDRGEYGALEGQNVTVDTNDTVRTTDRVNDGDTLDRVDVENTSIDDRANETIITTSLQVDDNATVENVVVENDSSAVVNVSSSNAALDSVIVNSTLSSGDGVNATVSGVTLTNSTIVSNDATLFEGGVGLELNDNSGSNVANNYFVGFETQVANIASTSDADTLFNNNEFSNDAVQSAVAFSGDTVNATSLFGSINASDSAASNGDTIDVSPGTYDEGETLVVATDNISIDGAGENSTIIENDVELNSSTSTTLANAEVNGSITAVADSNGDATVTVDTVTLPGSNVTIQEGNDVTVRDVTFEDAGVDAVNITATEPNVTVDNVEVNNLTGGTGISIADAGAVIDVMDNTVNSPTSNDVDGINVSDIIVDSDVDITGNDVTGIGDGTALVLTEDPADGEADRLNIDDNEFRAGDGGTNFTGIQYELANTTGTNITANTIVGADVSGGADSIGINFVNVTVTEGDAGGITGPDITDATALTIRDNVLNGHARIINSEDTEVLASDYTNILDLGNNDELNNTVGTIVLGPDGETYSETYGDRDQINLAGDTDTYLPGSVSEAADLVDAGPYDDVTLEVQDIDGVTGPDTYVDETVTYPNIDSLTIAGESSDRTPEVESRFVIDSSDALNNHALANLSVNNTDGSNPAINITDGHNSQSTFENLDVTSDDSGLVVNANSTDVNVIEVRDSDFDVAADGIVLADGADDRDGFVIENNTVTGDGIDTAGSIGLDLSQVEKPGKAGLETNLTVTDNYVTDFEVQVAGSTGTDGDDITALNFTSEQFSDEFDANGAITIDNNEFGQQVLVFEADAEPQNSNDENVSLNATNLFGSIQAAHDAVSADDDVIRVYDVTSDGVDYSAPSGTSTTYAEPLTIDENNVTVRGPAHDESADAAFRTDEALIDGTVELNDVGNGVNSSAAFTGFSVVADDSNDNVVNVTGNTGNLTVANTAVSAFGNESELPDEEVNGLVIEGTNGNGNISVESVFVGDHDAAATTNSSVVVEASSTLEIADSTLTSDVATADGTGVEYTAPAGSTTISNTEISNHTDAGVDAAGNSVNITVTDNTVIENNDAEGLNATVTDGDTVIVEDSEVANNNVTGVVADGNVTLTVNSTTVTGHDTGLDVENATADSSIIRSTVDANDVGLAVNASDVDPEITGNTFTNGDTDISTTDDDNAKLNASLNYFGTDFGPESDEAAGVDSDVVYDPFLSEDQTDSTVSETENTTSFAHDVIVPAGETASLGLPGNLNALTLDEVIDGNPEGTIYGFENGQFTVVDPSSTQVDAFDAFVIENDGNSTITASIEYSASSPASAGLATRDLDSGFNFVAAPVAGQTNATFYEAAEASQQNDFILEPFGTGSNLYGTGGQTAADFANPDEGFRSSFGAGDAAGKELHPHVGYLVFVQDQSPGVTVIEQIGPGVTVDEVEDQTNQTAS